MASLAHSASWNAWRPWTLHDKPAERRERKVMTSTKSQVDPISHAVHLCIDMQNIFSKGGLWETPWMERVLPTIVTLPARFSCDATKSASFRSIFQSAF